MRTCHSICNLLLALICPMTLWADNYVLINQVMYDTPLNEKTNVSPACNGEFIELYNAGSTTVSLQNWQITGDGTSEKVIFGSNIIIPAGKYLIVACHRGGTDNPFQLDSLYTMPNNSNYSVVNQNKIMLANGGETITLINPQNDTIDQMHYDGMSNLTDPDRLYATNADSIPGDSCVSLHRTWVEFDDDGKVIPGTSQWQTARVSFGVSMLPYATYDIDFITGSIPLPSGENYILTITPLDPVSSVDMTNGHPSVSNGVRTHSSLQYLDGLGRKEEIIELGFTPGGKDLVNTVDYHGLRKVARQWLPVAMKTEGQHIDLSAAQSQAQTDYADSRPFAETYYENSAQMRPTAQIQPGSAYEPHQATQTYRFNNNNDQVRIYTVNANGALHTDGAYYGIATLYKNVVADEDGKTVTTYTDKQGRKIMEERNGSRTYYVYDNLDRLRFVLPCLPSSKLGNGNYDINNTTLKNIAYCYNYDNRGNMTYKRLPGCKPQYMVYDRVGQLILKQDGNQRAEDKWTLCAYDSIGRNLYIAEITLTTEHAQLVSLLANQWQVEHYGNGQTNPIQNTGYASAFGADNLRLLLVNYYDNYEYLALLSATDRQTLTFAQESGYDLPHDNATGLLTGTRVYDLSEVSFSATAYYYDAMGRAVQSRSIRNTGGSTITSTEYLFDGSVAQQLTVQGEENDMVREHYRYTYDHVGRAKQVYYRLNNEPEIILSDFSYDSIGRLVQNLLHNKRDTIAYSYNIRNMLTSARNKHFSERLFYVDSLPQTASACYNGNIAASRIAQKDTAFTFTYFYDQLNRLTSSCQMTDYGSIFSEQYTYDDAGNVSSLKRFCNNRMVDNLSYSYGNEGNHLLSIMDNGQDADQYEIIEYHNGSVQADTTMRYDRNGNLIYDADRGISVVRYNILNLPDTIQFTNGNQIVNLYDASGRKYKSIIYTVPATAVTSHYEIEHYTFDTDTVEYLATEYFGNTELCYTRTDTVAYRIFNAVGYYSDSTYFHYVKDHLGNICAVVNSVADTVVQGTIYYASGVPMAQSSGREAQPYLYNGKEFVEAHGQNIYDYGFREYYAPIGRFTSVDPLAESTPWLSPYSYAGNRFVNAIDWMGLGGMTGFTFSYNWAAIDKNGIIIDLDLDSPDQSVYLVNDDDWDGSYWDLLQYEIVGNHIGLGAGWGKGVNITGKYHTSGNGYYNSAWGCWVSYGIKPRENADLLLKIFHADKSLVPIALMSLSEDIVSGLFKGILWDSHFTYNKQALQILSKCGKYGAFIIKNSPTIVAAGMIGYDMYTNGVNPNNVSDAVVTALSAYLTNVAMQGGLTGLASTIGTGATFALGAGVIAAEVYGIGYGLTVIANNINTQFGNYSFWGDWYLNGPSW